VWASGCRIPVGSTCRIAARGYVAHVATPAVQMIQAGTDLLVGGGQAVGRITSAVWSSRYGGPLALAYLHRGLDQAGTRIETASGIAEVVGIPSRGQNY